MSIYQTIWEADMNGNGIMPITIDEQGDHSEGYVVVDTRMNHPEHRIFHKVVIPEKKRRSYQLIEKLFDNYTLNQTVKEQNTPSETKEIEEFLCMAINTTPIIIAKRFIEEKLNRRFNEEQWYAYLHDLWFRQFQWESGIDLSGFEHVFVGEQKGKKLVGHHFWYKYFLEDHADQSVHSQDQIKSTKILHQNKAFPFVLTVGYVLNAHDHKKNRFLQIVKKQCAFLVGLSAEGLLALGTVRACSGDDIPKSMEINEEKFDLELYKSPDGKSIRTFYPIIKPS